MGNRISVLDVEIDNCTAKEAMRRSVEYMDTEPVNVIEMVTVDGIMRMDQMRQLKEDIRRFDLVLAGDKTILEAANIADRKRLQETEGHVFLKMLMRYLHKNHKRVYFLVESEEEGEAFYDFLQKHYSGIQIAGMAKVSAQDRADEMLVNAINGGEADCVLASLAAPLQEDFIVKNRNLLDIRLWVGLGKDNIPMRGTGTGQGRLTQFVIRHIFKKEIEKRKLK